MNGERERLDREARVLEQRLIRDVDALSRRTPVRAVEAVTEHPRASRAIAIAIGVAGGVAAIVLALVTARVVRAWR